MFKFLFFLLPTKGEFLSAYENDELKSQADALWRQLDGWSLGALLIFLVIGGGTACYYYGRYNNQPGRHYRIHHWVWFAVATIVGTGVVEFIMYKWWIDTNLKGGNIDFLYFKCAAHCAFWSFIVYFIVSFL
jgi:hypothetical protein